MDISVLTEAGMAITVADLNLGEGVTATAEPTEAVAVVSEAVEEVEEDTEDAQAAVDAVLADKEESTEE